MNLIDIIRRIFNLNFFLSVVIPIVIFVVLSHFNMIFLGTILAGSWSIAAISLQYARTRKVNIFAVIVAAFSVVGLIGTIVFHNPTFFLESPIAMDLALSCIFLGSLLVGRPLVQILAEYEMKDAFSQNLRTHPKYASAWRILTAGWGMLCISQAVLRLVLLHTASPEVYYSISSVFGNVSTPLFLLFTFWFPKWYWRDLKTDGIHATGAQNNTQ
jgi:intracellular septation protein A